MRWFVEITAFGQGPTSGRTLCVEASHWQPALQKARAMRGDTGSLSNFSIELLEEGYRAIDPSGRVLYMLQTAPDDAPLTEKAEEAPVAPPVAAPVSIPMQVLDTPKRERAGTLIFSSRGMAAIRDEALARETQVAGSSASASAAVAPITSSRIAIASAAPVARSPFFSPMVEPAPVSAAPVAFSRRVDLEVPASAAPAPPMRVAPTMPTASALTLISKREENPSERSPLTYREYVYAVAEGTLEEDAQKLLVERFEELRAALDTGFSGKLINLAIFDHTFQGKPVRRPLVTLTWKDWKGTEPEIRFPTHESTPPSAPPATSAPSSATPLVPSSYKHEEQISSPPASPRARLTPVSSSTPSTAMPSSGKSPSASFKRLSGDGFIAEMLEACRDLQFLSDPLDGADFILALALEKLPSEIGMISLFDANKREFVVVRQTGGAGSAIFARLPKHDALAQAALRANRAIIVPGAGPSSFENDERWSKAGVERKSLICAPMQVGGRYLGLLELANPLDGECFTDGDGNAVTYVGQQLAEFLAERELHVDPSHVGEEAFKGRRR